MLSKEDNELVTRVGPGTPMGDVMRRYWIPALLSTELPSPDCPPVRLKLLGEDLVAFRDTQGNVGIMEELLPPSPGLPVAGTQRGRRPALHLSRLEVRRRRQLCRPDERAGAVHHKVKANAYATFEQGDVIWAYMGPAELTPPQPTSSTRVSIAAHRAVTKVWRRCNWLQALEGGIDSSHAPILHRAFGDGAAGIPTSSAFVRGSAPLLEVDLTDYGYRYSGIRMLDEARAVRARLPLRHAVHPAPARSERGSRQRATRWSPATTGCRSMTKLHGLELALQLRRLRAIRVGAPHGLQRQRPDARRRLPTASELPATAATTG